MRIFNIITILIFYCMTAFSFHLTPTFFEKRIDGAGGYQEFTLYNNSTKTQRFKITALPGAGNHDGDMDKWVEFSPGIITIKPGSRNILKVFAKAPAGTAEGEYSAFLNFKSIPVPELLKAEGENTAAGARMGLNINVEIYGYAGDLKPKLDVENLKVTEDENGNAILTFDITNNTRGRGVWYNVDIMRANESYESVEKGRIAKGKKEDVQLVLRNMKKKDIVGIRLRDSSTHEEILKKKI